MFQQEKTTPVQWLLQPDLWIHPISLHMQNKYVVQLHRIHGWLYNIYTIETRENQLNHVNYMTYVNTLKYRYYYENYCRKHIFQNMHYI